MFINLAGIVTIVFIVWWFWLAKPKTKLSRQGGVIEVVAENGTYSPPVIEVTRGIPLTLRFVRKDTSPNAEKVVFSSLNVSADLPLNQPTDVVLTVEKSGTYEFTCQMGMYRGKLLVQ